MGQAVAQAHHEPAPHLGVPAKLSLLVTPYSHATFACEDQQHPDRLHISIHDVLQQLLTTALVRSHFTLIEHVRFQALKVGLARFDLGTNAAVPTAASVLQFSNVTPEESNNNACCQALPKLAWPLWKHLQLNT